jgi:TonB family protein
MANLLLFLVKCLIVGALLFSFYQVVMRRETYLQLNRIFLLGSAALMMILPLLGNFLAIPLPEGRTNQMPVINLPEVVITGTRMLTTEQQQTIIDWALVAYISITVAMLGGLTWSVYRIIRFYLSASDAVHLESNIFLVTGSKSPFSFLGRIFIPKGYEHHPHLNKIILHENAHIRQGHLADLVILELMSSIFWFNPFFFLIKRAMREVHEYLADREVIRQGTEALDYQQLLFNEVSGNPQYIIANNFNLLIKKRIIMLVKKSKKNAVIRLGILIPVIIAISCFIALTGGKAIMAQDPQIAIPAPPDAPPPPAFSALEAPSLPPAIPVVANNQQQPQKVVKPASKAGTAGKATTYPEKQPKAHKFVEPKVTGDTTKKSKSREVYTIVENMPEYPGGQPAMYDYLLKAIKYPDEARKKGITGTVYVNFVVEEDGTISTVKILRGIGGGCDEESIRVVKSMPKWLPGTQNGKKVAVIFNLPIRYALDAEKKDEKKN